MGKVMSVVSRPLKRYNVENRAHKVISRDKPTPAPHHKPFDKQLAMTKEADPGFMQRHNTKDANLDDRLKNVYLKSTTEVVENYPSSNPDRPLPQRRTNAPDLEFGVYEPENIPKGKCTLRQVIEFIENHSVDPAKYTAAEIAAQYNLNPETTNDILKHYKMFKVYIPESKSDKKNTLMSELFSQKGEKKQLE